VTVLAFDIGGTRIKAGLVAHGRVLTSVTASTDDSGQAENVHAQLVSLGRAVAENEEISAIGISVRGIVDPIARAVVDVNPPLRCLIGEPLAARLETVFGAPARIENDARAHALGELRHGAARGATELVCITIGTGIGVAVASGGVIVRGPRGMWGILGGHFTVVVDGPDCSCGNRGCLEALIGAQGIVADAADRLRAGETSTLSLDELEPASVFAAAAEGDAIARACVDRFADVLGSGVVSLVHAYDPDLVVVGGGVSASADQFLPRLRDYVSLRAWTYPKGRVRIEVSELGHAAALVGVAEFAATESLPRSDRARDAGTTWSDR
jgi:glucokinase